jgi:aldose 1-epimerase
MELSIVPDFGCHWNRLRISIKGEWVDFLTPISNGDVPLDSPTGQGSYALAPWVHRIPGGEFTFQGKEHKLRPNHTDGSALHGDVRVRPWKVLRSTESMFEATLETLDFQDFNYPFALRFHHGIELEGDRLTVRMTSENLDRVPAPVGMGYHPCLLRRLTWKDQDVYLALDADRVVPFKNGLPAGPAQKPEGASDLREIRQLGQERMHHCYSELKDGVCRLIYPGSGVEARFDFGDYSHVVIHTQEGGELSQWVAIEPLTHLSNALNLQNEGWEGTGVRVLEPGERWTASWALSVGDI